MIAEAQFTISPVLEEVRRLYEGRQTGVLLLTAGKTEQVSVSFREGFIDSASSSAGKFRLSYYLLRDGSLTEKDLDALQIESQKQNMVLGEAIVRKKLLPRADVASAVRRQSLDLLGHALDGRFKVASFTNALCSFHVPAGVTFPHLLLELSRNQGHLFDPAAGIRLALNADQEPAAFPWNPEELFVLSELQSPRTFETLLSATGLHRDTLRKLLGVLERVGAIRSLPPAIDVMSDGNAVTTRQAFPLEILIPSVTNAVLDEKLEVAKNEHSFASEQFRSLKIQLKHAESATQRKVFTISSPDAQDGKSLISINLALSFAQDPGCRVLIIDCDLRKPSLDRYLGVSPAPGLVQYLSAGPLRPHCFIRRVDRLYFLTAGGCAPNPIEALSMHKMKQLVEELRSMFDTILLDAPPYSPIADARVVTALSDGLIMVVRSGKTGYSSTDRALKMIDQRKLMGIVLNDVKAMPFQTYHKYGYYHYSGRGMVYPAGGDKAGKLLEE